MVQYVLAWWTAHVHEHTTSEIAQRAESEELKFGERSQFDGEPGRSLTAKWENRRILCQECGAQVGVGVGVAKGELVAFCERLEHFFGQ